MKQIDMVEVLYRRLLEVDKEITDGLQEKSLSEEEYEFLGMRGYSLCCQLYQLLGNMKSKRAVVIQEDLYDISFHYTGFAYIEEEQAC